MTNKEFSLKAIKRMVIGLGAAATVLLLSLLVRWKNPRLGDIAFGQAAPIVALLLLLTWCVVIFEMIEFQEDKIQDRLMEL